MKSFKRLTAFIALFALLFTVSGCNIVGDVSNAGIEDLMRPPVPSGENYGIQQALETELSGEIILKYPKSGDNRSAYTTFDIDSDNANEAIVFYQEKSTSAGDIYIHLLKKEGDNWRSKGRLTGKGSDVYAVYFQDLDNDGSTEILVLWELYDSRTKRQLAVYNYSGNLFEIEGITCSNIAVVNMLDGNDKFEILSLSLETNEVSSEASASLYEYTSTGLNLVDTVYMSSNSWLAKNR